MKENNIKLKLPLLFGITLAVGMFFGTKLQKALQPNLAPQQKINELVTLIKQYYVEDVNTDSILQKINMVTKHSKDSIDENTIQQVLEQLDPHSNYLPPVIVKQTNEEMKGEFAGIGVEYAVYKDTVFASYVLPNGPADKAKMQVGDKILKVNDSTVAGTNITSSRLRKLLRGENNSKVTITVARDNQIIPINITRGMVTLTSIDAAYMIDNTIGYIKLNKFSLASYSEFKDALKTLKAKGMTSLIFDLRDNGGGALSDAVNIVDEFIAGNELITYTVGKNAAKQSYYTNNKGFFEQGEVCVLIDEFSASASEVVAGALQDLDRATIIGRRSYGKGLVQRQFGFADNSAIRLTIAKYYTPSGRCIQKPYTKSRAQYNHDLSERYSNNSLLNADSNLLDKSKVYKTKAGKLVYGGGGIMPDHFVPLDTSVKYFATFSQLMEKNTLQTIAFTFYKKYKTQLQQYKDPSAFSTAFTLTEQDWQEILQQSKKDSIDLTKTTTQQKNYILERVKQLLARQLWRSSGYYTLLNNNDIVIKKAIGVLTK